MKKFQDTLRDRCEQVKGKIEYLRINLASGKEYFGQVREVEFDYLVIIGYHQGKEEGIAVNFDEIVSFTLARTSQG